MATGFYDTIYSCQIRHHLPGIGNVWSPIWIIPMPEPNTEQQTWNKLLFIQLLMIFSWWIAYHPEKHTVLGSGFCFVFFKSWDRNPDPVPSGYRVSTLTFIKPILPVLNRPIIPNSCDQGLKQGFHNQEHFYNISQCFCSWSTLLCRPTKLWQNQEHLASHQE